jgi:hypothetical protein
MPADASAIADLFARARLPLLSALEHAHHPRVTNCIAT